MHQQFKCQLISDVKAENIWLAQKLLRVKAGLGRSCDLLGSEKPLEVPKSASGKTGKLVEIN